MYVHIIYYAYAQVDLCLYTSIWVHVRVYEYLYARILQRAEFHLQTFKSIIASS